MEKKIKIFLLLSIVYIVIFPLFKNYVLDRDYYVRLIAEGTKNEKSLGTEVWIDGIYVDGEMYDFSQLELPQQGWELLGRVFNPGTEQDVLDVKIKYKETLEIVFVTHPYSGKVSVVNKADKKEFDLYSSEEGKVTCKFER